MAQGVGAFHSNGPDDGLKEQLTPHLLACLRLRFGQQNSLLCGFVILVWTIDRKPLDGKTYLTSTFHVPDTLGRSIGRLHGSFVEGVCVLKFQACLRDWRRFQVHTLQFGPPADAKGCPAQPEHGGAGFLSTVFTWRCACLVFHGAQQTLPGEQVRVEQHAGATGSPGGRGCRCCVTQRHHALAGQAMGSGDPRFMSAKQHVLVLVQAIAAGFQLFVQLFLCR